jgi:hypothetical protein
MQKGKDRKAILTHSRDSQISVADPGCLSRIQQEHRRGGKNLFSYFFCSHKFLKIENYFIFEQDKEKFLAN